MLTLAPQVEGDEVAQMLKGNRALELELEGHGTGAVGAGLLAHLHHQVTAFGAGEDQFAAHREVVVALGQGILGPLGLTGGEGARLPHAHHLQMQAVLFAATGVHHPEMGLGQVEMAAHQREQTAQHHRLDLITLGGADQATGKHIGLGRHVDAPHDADGPVLVRFGDRGDGVLAHGGGREFPPEPQDPAEPM